MMHSHNYCGISVISPNALNQKFSASFKSLMFLFLFHLESSTLLGPVFRMTHTYICVCEFVHVSYGRRIEAHLFFKNKMGVGGGGLLKCSLFYWSF